MHWRSALIFFTLPCLPQLPCAAQRPDPTLPLFDALTEQESEGQSAWVGVETTLAKKITTINKNS